MLEFLKNKRILVVVAHPDDEVIGLGSTINKLVKNHNCIVKCLILGEGITSRDKSRDTEKRKKELAIHQSNILSSKKIIGYQEIATYNFPDNRFDTVPLLDIVKVIENEKILFSPDIIFTHHGGDLNIDHQLTYESVITATRPLKNESVISIITFETFSGTEWQASIDPRIYRPNFFIEISNEELEIKKQAMDCYKFEKRDYPHPRSNKALKISAQKNGIIVGCSLAESFCIIRLIFKNEI